MKYVIGALLFMAGGFVGTAVMCLAQAAGRDEK